MIPILVGVVAAVSLVYFIGRRTRNPRETARSGKPGAEGHVHEPDEGRATAPEELPTALGPAREADDADESVAASPAIVETPIVPGEPSGPTNDGDLVIDAPAARHRLYEPESASKTAAVIAAEPRSEKAVEAELPTPPAAPAEGGLSAEQTFPGSGPNAEDGSFETHSGAPAPDVLDDFEDNLREAAADERAFGMGVAPEILSSTPPVAQGPAGPDWMAALAADVQITAPVPAFAPEILATPVTPAPDETAPGEHQAEPGGEGAAEEGPLVLPATGTPPAEPDSQAASAAPETSNEMEPVPGQAREVPRYQPPRQKVPRPPKQRAPKPEATVAPRTEETLEIRVHLTFDRFYFCRVGVLPERIADVEDDIDALNGLAPVHLTAQEYWYQDLEFDGMGAILRNGLELRAVLPGKRQVRWLLTRREIYVLATHPRAHGFVSANRLALGRSDVVLCVTGLATQAEALLKAAGCQGYVKFGEAEGAPEGWVGFRGVVPSVPIPLDEGSDRFYPLKPAPDIEIGLEGGIWLRNSAYLAGYPPQIKLYGAHASGVRVYIDGQEAGLTPEGALETEGSAAPGFHNVLCEGLSCSRSYSIEEPPESWEPWAAYPFRAVDICGPIIMPKAGPAENLFVVPMSNPLLIGPVPGQVYRCRKRQSAVWKGYVPFQVMWAFPEQPLACNKKTARIIQFGNASPVQLDKGKRPTEGQLRWSSAILDAARKGLRIKDTSASAAGCWGEYKKTARDIRRKAR